MLQRLLGLREESPYSVISSLMVMLDLGLIHSLQQNTLCSVSIGDYLQLEPLVQLLSNHSPPHPHCKDIYSGAHSTQKSHISYLFLKICFKGSSPVTKRLLDDYFKNNAKFPNIFMSLSYISIYYREKKYMVKNKHYVVRHLYLEQRVP